MRKKLAFLAAMVVFFCYNAAANIFVVTSNADSGPGTLREAITMANANGVAVTDYINFNISQPVFNLRIIDLVTELPALSSNIIIDGTTQPGSPYGSTDAKICLRKLDYADHFSMLTIQNAINTEVDGLCLYYGYWQGLFGSPARSQQLYGINLVNSKNIIIGSPAKGNVINGVLHGIYCDAVSCSDITIQSNYIGQGGFYTDPANDLDNVVLGVDCGITFASVKNIIIGGSLPSQGNIFGSRTRGINIDSRFATGNGLVRIQNNLFARSYDKVTVIPVSDFWDAYISFGRSRNNPAIWTAENLIDYRIELLDNDIPNHVWISYVSDSIIIRRNKFEGDYRNNIHTTKLAIVNSPGNTIIGGEDGANANYFKIKNEGTDYRSMLIYDDGPVTILKNIFECNTTTGSTTGVYNEYRPIPTVQVDTTSANFVAGTATPNTRIDLYYDDECTACEGKLYFAQVASGDDGKWSYNGSVNGTVVAISTDSQGYSSMFSVPMFNAANMVIKQPTCGRNNGSITGITTQGADSYFWLNIDTRDTASRSLDFINAGPGDYFLYAVHGGTCINIMSPNIRLEDVTPLISPVSLAEIIEPSCGLFNGSIRGLQVYNAQYAVYEWINSSGIVVGNQTDLDSAGPGTYRFIVTDTSSINGCADTATFTLVNQSGPALNTSGMQINPAACGNNSGSITGITATNVSGTPVFQWYDSLNNVVGNSYDLLNIPAGKYRFTFKDAGGCDTVQSPYYTVPPIGIIVIDTTGMVVTPTKCSSVSGSIEHIQVTGGSNYQWINTGNNIPVGSSADVFNLPSGNYQLTVTNGYGCSKNAPAIFIPQSAFAGLSVIDAVASNAFCSQNTGAVKINTFSTDTANYTFRWVDSTTGQNISTATSISGLPSGTYELFAKDNNSCEKNIYSARILSIPPPVINYTASVITNDECRLMQGSILLNITGLSGPTSYTWYDENDNIVGRGPVLQHVVAGAYNVIINDAVVCTINSDPFLVGNVNNALPPPLYGDVTILRNTDATINVRGAADGNYSLYADAGAPTPVQQNSTGNFIVPHVTQDTTVYIKRVKGFCSSDPVAVHIKVVDKSYFAVATAFTPNGDGINDRLNVRAVGSIELTYFRIYNQWGQLVFETHQMNDGWNGTVKGVRQNSASFVWQAEGKDISGRVIRDKGTFVLLR